MAHLIELDLNPSRRILRQFGLVGLIGFGAFAAFAWLEVFIFAGGLGAWREPVAATLAALGVLSAGFGLLYPPGNRPLFVLVTLIAFPIGFVVSHVILALLFYAVIAPAGLLLRLLGKDPMERRWDPDAGSYWVDARPQRSRKSYFRQY